MTYRCQLTLNRGDDHDHIILLQTDNQEEALRAFNQIAAAIKVAPEGYTLDVLQWKDKEEIEAEIEQELPSAIQRLKPYWKEKGIKIADGVTFWKQSKRLRANTYTCIRDLDAEGDTSF